MLRQSSGGGKTTQETHVENVFKDSKKKKRRVRKWKKKQSPSEASSSVSDIRSNESRSLVNNRTSSDHHLVSSGRIQWQNKSNMAFSSMPPTHLSKQIANENPKGGSSSELVLSNFGPEFAVDEEAIEPVSLARSDEVCNKAFEESVLLRELFSVNDHNSLEMIVFTEAKVVGIGPSFMSIYIPKLAIERRICYDEVEGLTVEWLDATSTLLLSRSMHNRSKGDNRNKYRPLHEIALIVSPTDLKLETSLSSEEGESLGYEVNLSEEGESTGYEVDLEPLFFPLTVHLSSTIPVALHAVHGGDGPLDIVARLYITSYLQYD